MQTPTTKAADIKRSWHLIDAKGKILGRMGTEIAKLLMGKSKSYFVRNLDCGDFVVVTNAKQVVVSGKKEEQKAYYRYSGYPGGLKRRTVAKQREQDPTAIVSQAVKGMLPQNRLRATMLKRLFIFAGEEHTYNDKFSAKGRSAAG